MAAFEFTGGNMYQDFDVFVRFKTCLEPPKWLRVLSDNNPCAWAPVFNSVTHFGPSKHADCLNLRLRVRPDELVYIEHRLTYEFTGSIDIGGNRIAQDTPELVAIKRTAQIHEFPIQAVA